MSALSKANPHHAKKRYSTWLLQEDNDPAGYKSRKAINAKKKLRIRTMSVPKHSPDLNVLDYRIWADINRRMRRQEKSWPKSKMETRAECKMRLQRTAVRTSTTFVQKAMKDMAHRCKALVKATGGYFQA
jgi:hypothetical protein